MAQSPWVDYDEVSDSTSIYNHVEFDSFGAIISQSNTAHEITVGYTGRYVDVTTGDQLHGMRWYNPETGRWESMDPGGFAMGDVNLYRYVENGPTNWVDPSGWGPIVPAVGRGGWEGEVGNSIFTFDPKLAKNIDGGVAGMQVEFEGGYIKPGGFPFWAYFDGDPAKATVDIGLVKGRDATCARNAMRLLLEDPSWNTPKGFVWHHAGAPGLTMMELIDEKVHRAVHHEGSASSVRAAKRASRNAVKGIGRAARGLGGAARAVGWFDYPYDLFKDWWQTNERAEECGRSFWDQYEQDNEDKLPLIIGPWGPMWFDLPKDSYYDPLQYRT